MDLVGSISAININRESPLNIETFAALIDNLHTEFIIAHFQNCINLIITQFGKIGNLYSVEAEQVENGILNNEPVYNLRTLLGKDDIEVEVGVRYIAEKLNFKKPLVFSLSLKHYDIDHLKLVVEATRKFKSI